MNDQVNITADAVALQERDEFRAQGWLKLIARLSPDTKHFVRLSGIPQ